MVALEREQPGKPAELLGGSRATDWQRAGAQGGASSRKAQLRGLWGRSEQISGMEEGAASPGPFCLAVVRGEEGRCWEVVTLSSSQNP